MEQSKKANDYLPGYTRTENWYKTIVPGITYTDGVQALCDEFHCYWFLDVISSYQIEKKFKDENLIHQKWILR